MITANLDVLLDIIARISWVVFGVFTIIFFIRTILKSGIIRAFVSLFSYRVLLPLLLTLIITLISLALVFIEPQMVGVVVSIVSPSGIRPQPLQSGLHWIVPILENEVQYPIYWNTYTMSSKPHEGEKQRDDSIRARTSDGQEVLLDCSVIFRVDPAQAVRVHIDWQDRYEEEFVRPVTRGYVRTQVSQFTVTEVNSSARRDLETTLDRILRDEFASKGLILDQFVLRDIAFSPEYSSAIEEKQVALEGQLKKEYEAEQIRRLARGEADAVRIEAQAQAEALELINQVLIKNPNLLEYKYIEKIAPNIRVMLLPHNTPLILPLPNLDEPLPLTSTEEITLTMEAEDDISLDAEEALIR